MEKVSISKWTFLVGTNLVTAYPNLISPPLSSSYLPFYNDGKKNLEPLFNITTNCLWCALPLLTKLACDPYARVYSRVELPKAAGLRFSVGSSPGTDR